MHENQWPQATFMDIVRGMWVSLLVAFFVGFLVFFQLLELHFILSFIIMAVVMPTAVLRSGPNWIVCSCGKTFEYKRHKACPGCHKSHNRGED